MTTVRSSQVRLELLAKLSTRYKTIQSVSKKVYSLLQPFIATVHYTLQIDGRRVYFTQNDPVRRK